MKILHLITRLTVGGAMENTILTCEDLARRGHEVFLAAGPSEGPEGTMLPRVLAGDYEYIELPDLRRKIDPLLDFACYSNIRSLLRSLKPQIVHTHSSKAGILGRAAAWHEKTPLVVHTIHGLPFHPYQNPFKNLAYIRAERFAAKRCHQIITVANAMTRQARAEKIGRDEQFTTIHSGIDLAPYLIDQSEIQSARADLRKQFNFADDHLVIGVLARLFEHKGHDDLLDIFPELIEKHPNLRMLWLGDGIERDRLERRIAELDLKGHIVLTGLISPDEVPRHLRAIDVLVHPSYREGLARAIPQAMLCHKPVVAYDCDGAPEAITDDKTGLLVPTGDTEALSAAIDKLASVDELRARFAKSAFTQAKEVFDANVMIAAIHRLYRENT